MMRAKVHRLLSDNFFERCGGWSRPLREFDRPLEQLRFVMIRLESEASSISRAARRILLLQSGLGQYRQEVAERGLSATTSSSSSKRSVLSRQVASSSRTSSAAA